MGTVFPRQSDNMKLLQFLLLLLWPLLSLKPRLALLYSTEPTDMASPTPVSTVATEPMVPIPIAMATTARGLLRLSPRLTPLSSTEQSISSTEPTDMASPTPLPTGPMVLTPMHAESLEPSPISPTKTKTLSPRRSSYLPRCHHLPTL